MNTRLYLLFFSFILFACNNNKPQEKKEMKLPPRYYYYPKANVYFDSANKDFIFLANDGATWQMAKQIPAAMQVLMDKSAFIENPSQPVWKDNEKHKLIYSALLYATPTDTIKKKPVIVKKTAPPVDNEGKNKERNGIRKFIDKLFGRIKKKDKDENKQQ